MRRFFSWLATAAGLLFLAVVPAQAQAQGYGGYPTVPTYPYGAYGPNFSMYPSYGYYPPRYALGPYVAYPVPYYPPGVLVSYPGSPGSVSGDRWSGVRWHRRW
jgi:hypothetical protein